MPYKEERFELNQGVAGITESDGQGATWGDIWDFTVPLNTWIRIKPSDLFACYLVGDDTAEMPAATQVRVVVRDVANADQKPILPNLPYQRIKAFADVDKLKRLTVAKETIVGPDEHIVVMVNGKDVTGVAGDTDASLSNFKLVTTRRRKGLD